MRQLDVGVNADGLVNMIHDYTQVARPALLGGSFVRRQLCVVAGSMQGSKQSWAGCRDAACLCPVCSDMRESSEHHI